MRLQAEVPLGVVEDVLYHLFCIQAGTGLEEMPGCFQTGVFRQVLSCIDHFDLIYMCQPQGNPFGEQVTQSMPSGNGFVPLVSMQIYFPAMCSRSIKVWSIQSEGSPPVKITTFEGKAEIACKISSSDIKIPSSCRVSQKLHFRLHPEKRTKTAGVPVWKPSP